MHLKIYIVLIVILCSNGLCAQQNLFNVPSSDITPVNKTFFQQQINYTKESVVSNTTFCFGVLKNFEIGVDVLAINYDRHEHKLSNNNDATIGGLTPELLLNMQKKIVLNNHYSIGLGTQIGNTTKLGKQWVSYNYINTKANLIHDKLHLVLGMYNATKGYASNKNEFGLQTGFEYCISNKVSIMADYISGTNPISVAVVGGMYYVTKHMPLSLGVQIPSPNSGNKLGLVFEFTYLPSSLSND